jgi:exonuclease VII small subunit
VLKREIISITKEYEKKIKKLNLLVTKKDEIIKKLDQALINYEKQLDLKN